MTTPPPVSATLPVSVSVNDPVSANVQAACAAITALCNFACTTQGQALIGAALKSTASAQAAISTAWTSFTGLFGKG